MSLPRLKKQLAPLNRDQLEELIADLYSARKEAKEYLDFWAEPDQKKMLDKYMTAVRRVFFSGGVTPRRRPSLTDLNHLVHNFMTLPMDHEMTASFLFAVVEHEADWLELRWRRLSYRTSIYKNLNNLRLYIENLPNGEEEKWKIRLERTIERVDALFVI